MSSVIKDTQFSDDLIRATKALRQKSKKASSKTKCQMPFMEADVTLTRRQ